MSRILIAEDDDAVRSFVQRALQMDGHEVVAEPDGADALERLEREGGGYDLLISDIRMPVMDGIALALTVGASYPDLPILLMTGFADQRERAHDLDAIIEDVLTKPFSLQDIRDAAKRILATGKTKE